MEKDHVDCVNSSHIINVNSSHEGELGEKNKNTK